MQHSEQLASVLRRSVQSVLTRGLNDPRIRGLITVTEVRVSPDGTQAAVLVSIQPEEHADLTMHGLRSAGAHIRWQVAKTAGLRRIPQLTFKLDRSLKKQSEVLAAINRAVRREEGDEDAEPASPGEEPEKSD